MTSKKRGTSNFTHIREIIESILPRYQRESNTVIERIRRTWNDMLPPEMAEHAQPARLKNDVLMVHVTSSTLTHQLRFMTEEIKQHLNAAENSSQINTIKFKVGKV
ncbi:MAG: DUF721 domain-containing protein [Desulfobacterales bacterium]